ncbi:MAG: Asp23/Gls24 family envelope stress response protein [Actinobacteria bacterium]|nr:Asp23/Gls24 family envelope stress response protein [Actinomycetota bacterium]
MTVATGSTSNSQPAPDATLAPATPPTTVDPEERGRLKIDSSVLRKIAEHTADLTPGTLRARRHVAGVGLGSTGATVKVAVTGQRVDLWVELALCYPGSVRSTVEQLRRKISEEIQRITGYQVRSIAVTVTGLLPESTFRVR